VLLEPSSIVHSQPLLFRYTQNTVWYLMDYAIIEKSHEGVGRHRIFKRRKIVTLFLCKKQAEINDSLC